jgi:hypothetical protein
MSKLNQRGAIDPFLIPLIMVTLILLGVGSFGIWAFMSRQDYKANSDEKVSAAVAVAQKQTASQKDNEFVEKEKLPLKEYDGPAAYGSVVVKYPKTWSAYVIEQSGNTPIDGYFNPVFVPSTVGGSSFALRVQVTGTNYAQELKKYDSYVKNGTVKAAAYVPAKVPGVTGVRLTGEIVPRKNGVMIMVPMRDKTLKIWTESTEFVNDFDNNILPNYTFEP